MGRIKLIYQSLQTCEFVIDHWQKVLKANPTDKKALKFLNRAQYRQRQLIKQKSYYEKFI